MKAVSGENQNTGDYFVVLVSVILIYIGLLQQQIFEKAALVSVCNMLWLIVVFFIVPILYFNVIKKYRIQKLLIVLAACFAIVNLMGECVHYQGSIRLFALLRWKYRILFTVSGIGSGVLFYYLSLCLYAYWDGLKMDIISPIVAKVLGGANRLLSGGFFSFLDFNHGHDLWICVAIILIGWMPWLVFFYPGSINWDVHRQLGEFYHLSELTNHHPVFSTLIIGTFVKMGEIANNYSLGIYLYILFQSLCCAIVYAYVLKLMQRLNCGKGICLLVLIWYAFYPLWGGTAQFGDKDVLFCAVCLAFALKTYLYVFEYEKIEGLEFVIYVILGVLSCLLRNNMIYMVIVAVPFLLIAGKNRRKMFFLVNILIIAMTLWLTSIVWPVFGVKSGSKAEALSVIFQQTARLIKEHGSELTVEDREIIDQVLDVDKIGDVYVSVISDPVKETYRLNGNEEENAILRSYFQIWGKLALCYPITYIDAFLGNSYGYYSFISPIESDWAAPSERFYTGISGRKENQEFFNFRYIFDAKKRSALYHFSEIVRDSFCGVFYQCALYTWTYFIGVVYMIARKSWDKVGSIILIILTIGVCCVSPANDLFRYYIVAAAFLPMILTLGHAILKSRDTTV